MVRTVNVTGSDVKDSKSTGFAPLPAGKYNVSIFEHEIKQYKNGVNAGRDYIALQLRISDGQKGANRRLFTNVGDFPRWALKPGADETKVNFQFFGLYKALGVEFADGVDGDVDLPDYEDLDGSVLAVKVVIKNDSHQYEKALGAWKEAKDKAEAKSKPFNEAEPLPGDFLKNEVKEFFPPLDEDELASESADDEFDL